jgi:hypothetical protein
MPLNLNLTIENPYGGEDLSYAIAHLIDKSYAGPEIAMSWEQSAQASLTFFCNWTDLGDFIVAMLGDCVVEAEGENRRYVRHLPHRFPAVAFPNLWATRVTRIVGLPGRDPDWEYDSSEDTDATAYAPTADFSRAHLPQLPLGSNLVYRYAAVTVQYEAMPFEIKKDSAVPYDKEWLRFTTIQKVPRLEFINIQGRILYWIDTPEANDIKKASGLPHNIPLRDESIDYVVTLHRIPEPFFNPQSYVGFVNSENDFLAGHPQIEAEGSEVGLEKETMLLVGISERIIPVAWTKKNYYDFSYYFTYKPNTHNKARRINDKVEPPTFAYNGFSLDGKTPSSNDTRVFKSTTMSSLFLPNS